ncbi:MAG: chloride channel protein [Propionibacteriaceae bacterium]
MGKSRICAVARHVMAVLCAGVAAGLVAIVLTILLHSIQHLAFPPGDHLVANVVAAPLWRKLLSPAIGAVLVGVIWWWVRSRKQLVSLESAISNDKKLPWWDTVADAVAQVVVVGAGASIGREGAPRQVAAAAADALASLWRLGLQQRRYLVAAAAGAGLAAVYNVPLAGIVFACEIALGAWSVTGFVISAAVSAVACVVAWPVVTSAPALTVAPQLTIMPHGKDLAFAVAVAVIAIPITALVGSICSILIKKARNHGEMISYRWLPALLGVVGVGQGLVMCWLPELVGNGKDPLQIVLDRWLLVPAAAVLIIAKPCIAALWFRAGAVGGILMPSLLTGGALGFTAATICGVNPLLGTLIGAAGVLAVTQQAWIFATIFVVDLTHAWWLVIPLSITTLGATSLVRFVSSKIESRS